MKNATLLVFVFVTSLNSLILQAFAQNQWPANFPYPPDFPQSGQGVTIAGVGDSSGPFIATYTYYTQGGGIGYTFPVTNQIKYEFLDYTSTSGVGIRSKERSELDNFAQQPGLLLRSVTGFIEMLISNVPPNGPDSSAITRTDIDWDYKVPGPGIEPRMNTTYAQRIDTSHPVFGTTTYKSHAIRVYNSRYPLLPPRDEEITVTFTDEYSLHSWVLTREYKTGFAPLVSTQYKYDADSWPGAPISPFNATPPPELFHYYGLDLLTYQDAFDYILLWGGFHNVPWTSTPFF